MKKLTLLTAMVCLAVLACQKNNTPQPEAPARKNISAALAASSDSLKGLVTDVYVTGTYEPFLGQFSAAYWKNGKLVNLTPDSYGSEAFGIAVKGNDVYVTGQVIKNNLPQAVYWKNGVIHPLNYSHGNTFSSNAYDIALYGNDVYIVGDYIDPGHRTQAILWKNEVPHTLSYNHFASSAGVVKVKGGDVYVAGYSAVNDSVGYIATYWKNTSAHRLENSKGFSFVSSMAISGNDIYIAGETSATFNAIETVVYWKNGIRTNVQYNGSASGIAISNNNVFIAGTTVLDLNNLQFQATYWKNSTPTLLGDVGYYFGRDIQVVGNDVYLLTEQASGGEYFKNGVRVPIPDSNPSRILVVQHL